MSGLAYNFMGPQVNTVIECPLVFNNQTCTGLQKLMQKVITLFLKDRTTSTNPELGTNIVEMVGSGNNLLQGELANYLSMAASIVKNNLANPADPLDEQISTIYILPAQDPLDKGRVLVTINVTSKAGAAATSTISI